MPRYRKKPIVIEARQYAEEDDVYDLMDWIGDDAEVDGRTSGAQGPNGEDWGQFIIHTLEGDHEVAPFDWIIRGVKGEFYACKPDVFDMTYEAVGEEVKQ